MPVIKATPEEAQGEKQNKIPTIIAKLAMRFFIPLSCSEKGAGVQSLDSINIRASGKH
jgi:hypothetical protein